VELAEVRRQRALEAAVKLLSDEDLRLVGVLVDSALSSSGAIASEDKGPVNLWAFAADAREHEALEHLERALEASLSVSPEDSLESLETKLPREESSRHA
jgi:hypothetical protein